jgi:diaminopimelate decarboxylase
VEKLDWQSTGLTRRGRKLWIGKTTCESLAKQYGTPLWVINEPRIRDNVQRVRGAFSEHYDKVRIHYACKANSALAVLAIARQEGCMVDAVSPGEVYLALKAGFKPEQILFTGNNTKNEELAFALRTRVRITVDSMSQIRRLAKMARSNPPSIAIRVNPEVGAGHHDHCITGGRDAKFGVWQDQAREAAGIAKESGLPVVGVHMHIGSGIPRADPFLPAIRRLMELAGQVQEESGSTLEFIDIGGGLGVPYRPDEEELDLGDFASKVVATFLDAARDSGIEGDPWLALEPGRYLVADACVLLATVTTLKETPFRTFVGVDAGFNDLIRPAMYGSYHHILNATNMSGPRKKVDVAGPLCESGDLFARDRELTEPREGDIIAILNAGAYGFSMSSQYNSRPRAAEVLVSNGESELVRERESFNDLVGGQKVPQRLLS